MEGEVEQKVECDAQEQVDANEKIEEQNPWDWFDMIYVIGHPTHEKRRVDNVLRQLHAHGCPRTKICISAPTWGSELSIETIFRVYDPFLPRAFPNLIFKSRGLTKGEISLNLNFYSAVRDALNKKCKRILTLESDVMFREDFNDYLRDLQELINKKEKWDYISLSDGTGTHGGGYNFGNISYHTQDLVVPASCFPFRCTDSMILSERFITYLSKNLLPFRDCLDWELNYQLSTFNGSAFWAEPHLIEQTSLKRLDESLLSTL
jgi:hypothetical protein